MTKGSIDSPQNPAVKVPATPRKNGDLDADQVKVSLGGKSGSGVIDSPTSPKLGGKNGAS
jgi:hypothetical protein